MKITKNIIIQTLFSLLTISLSYGFSTHDVNVTRQFSVSQTQLDNSITVTVSILNNEQGDLNGFYYVEQIPYELVVKNLNVRINGISVNDYQFESGASGDVSPGYVPYRWIIEFPPKFIENNPIADAPLEIVFTITSGVVGTFNLSEFSWVGCYSEAPTGDKAAFGHSKDDDMHTLVFNEPPTTGGDVYNDGSGGSSGAGCFISSIKD